MANETSETGAAINPAPTKRDFRQEVTDRIIGMLENGVAPWQKPWTPGESPAGMPVNPTTDPNYRGGNALHLMVTDLLRGYNDPRWMTYKQASDQGWQVRRGEKGTQIEFWDVKPADKDASRAGNDTSSNERNGRDRETRLVHRVYTVFNAKQIDGIPDHQPKLPTSFEIVNAAEKILDNSAAKINHDQADKAF